MLKTSLPQEIKLPDVVVFKPLGIIDHDPLFKHQPSSQACITFIHENIVCLITKEMLFPNIFGQPIKDGFLGLLGTSKLPEEFILGYITSKGELVNIGEPLAIASVFTNIPSKESNHILFKGSLGNKAPNEWSSTIQEFQFLLPIDGFPRVTCLELLTKQNLFRDMKSPQVKLLNKNEREQFKQIIVNTSLQYQNNIKIHSPIYYLAFLAAIDVNKKGNIYPIAFIDSKQI